MYFARRVPRVIRLASCSLLVVGAVSTLAANPQERGGGKWWQNDRYKQELGLSVEQSAKLEAIFQASVPRFRELKQELDEAEKALSRMISEATVAEGAFAQQVDRVEGARSALGKARMLMLYRMHRVLTIEQRAKLNKLHGELGDHRRPRS